MKHFLAKYEVHSDSEGFLSSDPWYFWERPCLLLPASAVPVGVDLKSRVEKIFL